MSKKLILLAFVFLVLTGICVPISLFSQWKKEQVSKGARGSIAVDIQGDIHLCYLGYHTEPWNGDLVYAHKKADQWLTDTLTTSGIVTQCVIVADSLSRIHIAFVERNWDTGISTLKHTRKEGGSWSSRETVTTSEYGMWAISLDTDKDGFLHAAYIQSNGMASEGPLVYLNNRDGQWKEKYRSLSYDDYVYDYASMAVDSNGHAHFAFYNLSNGGPGYKTNAPNGNWSAGVFFHENWIGGQMEGMMIDIALDPAGKPHISYVGSNIGAPREDHRYATNKTGNWVIQKVDNGQWTSTGHTIASDPDTVIHIAYNHNGTGELRYAMNSSGSWPHETIDKPGKEFGQIVDMVSDKNGFVHIIYNSFVYDIPYSYTEYVMYATNRLEIPAPNIVLSPPELAFGIVDTGKISKKLIYIRNDGTLDLHVSDVRLSGKNATEFSLLHSCDVIVPEDSCEVELTFAPEKIGRKQAALEVESDDPDMPVIKADITGRTPIPVIQPVPGEITFSTVEVGQHDVKMLTLKNTGDANLEIDSLKITGEGADAYSWISICQDIPPFTDCNLDVYFAPPSPGTHYAELHIYSNDPENPAITVSLKGRPPSGRMEIQNGENNFLDFGTVIINNFTSRQLVLENTGEHPLIINLATVSGTDASFFSSSNTCKEISPGELCSVELIFYPLTTGRKSAIYTIISNDPDQPEYNIILQGIGGASSASFMYGTEETLEKFYCLDTLSTGNLIVGGKAKIHGNFAEGSSAYLATLSTDGKILWQKRFSFNAWPHRINVARETWDRGYIIGGSINEYHRWIARLDLDGEILWQKHSGELHESHGQIRDIKVTSDSAFIVVGVTNNVETGYLMWIAKLDSIGNVIWQNALGFFGNYFDVLETDDGNFIVAGNLSHTEPHHALKKHPDGGYLYGGHGAKLAKFSPDGTLIWQKEIGPTDIYLTKFWLVRFSQDDNILWQYSYPIELNKFELINDLTVTESGDIIVLGYISVVYRDNIRVMRLRKTGEVVWQKKLISSGILHRTYKIQALSTGATAIAGYIKNDSQEDGWLIILSSEGTLDGCIAGYYLEDTYAVPLPANYSFENINLPVIKTSHFLIDSNLVPSEGDFISQNLCSGLISDLDNDGISNEEEYGPSGLDTSYDGNNDGHPDALQSNVASFHTFNRSGYVTLEAPSGTKLKDVSAEDNPSPGDQPEDISFPLGFFKFSVTGLEVGGSVTINLHFPAELTPVTYYKYAKTSGNPEPHWYEFLHDGQTGAVIEPGKIILHFKDGARGDEDLIENGIIEDIGGPGTQKTTGIENQTDPSNSSISAIIYPNPSRGNTNIGFRLSQTEHVKIEVYDFLGRKVRTLISEELAPGYHKVEFRPGSLPGGVYLIHIEAGKYKDIKKLMLLK